VHVNFTNKRKCQGGVFIFKCFDQRKDFRWFQTQVHASARQKKKNQNSIILVEMSAMFQHCGVKERGKDEEQEKEGSCFDSGIKESGRS